MFVTFLVLSVFFMSGAPKGSTGSGSGFKTSLRRGHSLKSHPTDWWSPVMTKQLLTGSYQHKQISAF